MAGNLRWTKLIESNLVALTDCTVIGTVLVVNLYSKGLIDVEEKDLFLDFTKSNKSRATRLYTRTAKKWSDRYFEDFKKILHDTGNNYPLQILTGISASGLKVKVADENGKQIKLLKRQMKTEEGGSYEGISLEAEERGNKIVEIARKSQILPNGGVHLVDRVDENEVFCLLKQFEANLKNKKVWWNPQKPRVPGNLIPRKVSKTKNFNETGSVLTTKTLLEASEEKFVFLVDFPGMGKSTEATQLEKNLRQKYQDNRVIVRINLKDVQATLSMPTISKESAAAVLLKLAPFLPTKTLQIPGIRIFVLLDALDKVCPTHQTTMLNLLRILNFSKEPKNLHVLLTTRQHLKEAVEDELNVESYSLICTSSRYHVCSMLKLYTTTAKMQEGEKTPILGV